MAKEKSTKVYVCSECGHQESKWIGRCPECGAWNTFVEEVILPSSANTKLSLDDKVRKLCDVPYEKTMRVTSGLDELDRVLGGGVMRPSAVLVGGEPGIGKSTIMLQMLSSLSKYSEVLYVSGEESPSQVRLRAERLGLDTSKINIFCDTKLEVLTNIIETLKPSYIVVDSLQTLYSSSSLSLAGSPNQVKVCAMELAVLCKRIGSALFLIGHVTKDGNIAGPKLVEHMVDTVLYFESIETGMRLLRASKNRFGSVDEIGIFSMESTGLKPIADPSSYFLTSRDTMDFPAGIVFTPVTEGTRTFIVEIQALVVPAKSGYPRIYSDRIDSSRVQRIAAILERHAGLDLSDSDIYLNVAGGMKLTESSIELAVALALYSSKRNIPLSTYLSLFGELSLAGEIRPVQFAERRIKTLIDMGFTKIVTGDNNTASKESVNIVKNIKNAIIVVFKK